MSQTASISLIKADDLENLVELASHPVIIKKNWLGKVKEVIAPYQDKLNSCQLVSFDYKWSGYSFIVLFEYLKEKFSWDWDEYLESENADKFSAYGRTVFIFSLEHKNLIISRLNPENFTISELEDFANEYSGKESDNGQAVMDAIRIMHEAIKRIEKNTVLILEVS